MELTIKKWGNSFGVILPKSILKDFRLSSGDKLSVFTDSNETIILKPNNRKEELAMLLSKITEENMHNAEFDTPVGKELW